MKNSLTIVIPNRNRDLNTVKRSIASIIPQLDDHVKLVIVDYGSPIAYQKELDSLMKSFLKVELILCPTQGQLWNKSRCINIVLKNTSSSHFMVCDMDMIWCPEFLEKEMSSLSMDASVYFTVGIMTQEESAKEKDFENYDIKFKTDDEATGITIFPTEQLKSINGFDEFYHGWGSEDTDAHMRMRNAGYDVRFRESELYFKHQWHGKAYRSKESKLPYHSHLERINHSYFTLNKTSNKVKANKQLKWGKVCDIDAYSELNDPKLSLEQYATEEAVQGIIHFLHGTDVEGVIKIEVKEHPQSKSVKSIIKKATGKKTPRFMSIETVNEVLLEAIIMNHRDCAYNYGYDRIKEKIHLSINLISDS
ncbi:glycosyltransferase family 2 protein [Nonlabens ulvanivorans]|uniref:glycosyltransferase family 2 protein n=1 Tax=Nonlabens ulvanivorans TaxID=906888 RepID=UPI0037C69803